MTVSFPRQAEDRELTGGMASIDFAMACRCNSQCTVAWPRTTNKGVRYAWYGTVTKYQREGQVVCARALLPVRVSLKFSLSSSKGYVVACVGNDYNFT